MCFVLELNGIQPNSIISQAGAQGPTEKIPLLPSLGPPLQLLVCQSRRKHIVSQLKSQKTHYSRQEGEISFPVVAEKTRLHARPPPSPPFTFSTGLETEGGLVFRHTDRNVEGLVEGHVADRQLGLGQPRGCVSL